MLETNLGEIRALAENSDPIIADPPNIKLLTGPLPNPGSDPNFFDLTPNDDAVQLANGILRDTPGGLRALDGNDFVRGSGGAELMNGNSGTDTLIGGCGSDFVSGDQGDDYVYGGTANDFIRGGKGNDALVGESGNDTLIGDAGIDRLWGSEGADLFVLRTEVGGTSGEIGSLQPPPSGNFDVDEVPADFILDYNPAEGDVIGLASGLTRNDIVLSERFLTIGDARDYDSSGPFPPAIPRTADFRILNTKATVIREASSGNILGLVKDVSPDQLQFISISDGTL
jgi:Ca2+-binding RTX toxin-like protein